MEDLCPHCGAKKPQGAPSDEALALRARAAEIAAERKIGFRAAMVHARLERGAAWMGY